MRRRFSTTQRWLLFVADGTRDRVSRLRLLLVLFGSSLVIASSVAPGPGYPFHGEEWGAPGLALGLRFLAFMLALAALVLAATRRRTAPARASGAAIVADAKGLSRVSTEGAKPIVHWDVPFGITLLASYGRPNALLAFTTPTQTRYIPTRLEGRSEEDDELFSRIAVLTDLDLVDGATHEAALASSDAAALVRHASGRTHGDALGRIYMSDVKGAPIALDHSTLSVDTCTFDLTSHLEWRSLMFHESTGQAAALYQATWIRQNTSEVVLVAPMPASIVPREPDQREAGGRLGRTLTRDLRLLQSPAEPPPSRDLRVAIDRPFMMAVRRFLDEAPLALRIIPPTSKARSEKRDSIA
jgi:hypothetical protein